MRRGFTLVEILTVVVILGIAAAVIVPQLGTNDDLKASAAARRLTADLIYAQNKAITDQQMVYVKFELSGVKSYAVLISLSPETYVTHPVTRDEHVTVFGAGGTPGLRDVTVESADFDDQATLAFDELGQPYAVDDLGTAVAMTAGEVVIKSGAHSLTLVVEPYTGSLSVK